MHAVRTPWRSNSDTTYPPIGRTAWIIAALTLACRLPFVARRLWDHDSIQFALGVEAFDLLAHHPHPPGYPLYIGLLKGMAMFGVEPLVAMAGLSLIASALGAAAMVALSSRLMVDSGGGGDEAKTAGVLAGVFYAVHPILWFYAELSLVYAIEGALTVLIAWSCWRARDGLRELVTCAVLYGLAAGIRPSTAVLLAPLLLLGLIRAWRGGRLTISRLLTAAAAGAAAVGIWAIPMLIAVGGLSGYREASGDHFGALLPQTSVLYGAGLGALKHNLFVTVKWTIQGLVPAGAAFGLLIFLDPKGLLEGLRRLRSGAAFLAVWLVPPVLFFALFHITKAGYTLIFQPAILVTVALVCAVALAGRAIRLVAVLALAGIVGGSLFLFSTDRSVEEPEWMALFKHRFQRRQIESFESSLDETLAAVRRFDPQRTVLIALELSGRGDAGSEGFLYPWHRHLQWYLPEYTTVYLIPEEERAWVIDRGHQPMRAVESEIDLAFAAENLVIVLSERPGSRFDLGLGSIEVTNEHFLVLRTPMPETGRLGAYSFRWPESEAEPQPEADEADSEGGRAGIAAR